jgi:hypothetical protein
MPPRPLPRLERLLKELDFLTSARSVSAAHIVESFVRITRLEISTVGAQN